MKFYCGIFIVCSDFQYSLYSLCKCSTYVCGTFTKANCLHNQKAVFYLYKSFQMHALLREFYFPWPVTNERFRKIRNVSWSATVWSYIMTNTCHSKFSRLMKKISFDHSLQWNLTYQIPMTRKPLKYNTYKMYMYMPLWVQSQEYVKLESWD